ncbi:MAG: endonuclease [Bacillus sp. (in: firmicutes)]
MISSKEDSIFLSLICGKLLGDGCFIHQHGRKPRFQFMHKQTDFEWCHYCYEQLRSFIPLNPPFYRKVKDIRVVKGYTESYMVQSKTAGIITHLDTIWYPVRKKVVPIHFLEKYLNERALAWWYLDDGHLKIDHNIPRKIILSTDNFSSDENFSLIKLLKQKFSLSFSLDGQNRLVLYDSLQIHYFYQLIKPFIHPSMSRKTIQTNSEVNKKFPNRTSIYLPAKITLKKPTYEINEHLCSLSQLYLQLNNQEDYLNYYKKYFLHIAAIKSTKSYQISIEPRYRYELQKIHQLTGLNNSQIVTLCFMLSMNDF